MTKESAHGRYSCAGLVLAAVIGAVATLLAALISASAYRENAKQAQAELEARLSTERERSEAFEKRVAELEGKLDSLSHRSNRQRENSAPEPEPPLPEPTRPPEPVRLKPEGVEASIWGPGSEARKALDGDTASGWGMEERLARGAWIEAKFRSQKTINTIQIFINSSGSPASLKVGILRSGDGETRKIAIEGFEGWNKVDFAPMTSTTFRLEVEETRKGSFKYFILHELELSGF